jgi:putative salt-induced outer membrane protein
MKIAARYWLLALLALASLSAAYADEDPGFHNESELGIVISAGNADSQSYNFGTKDRYNWDNNVVRLFGKYLHTSSNGADTAKYWDLGVRYERVLTQMFSVYVGEMAESDIFSGYTQRYNSDVGGKYFIYKEKNAETGVGFVWNVELGYRYTVENDFLAQKNYSSIRVYTEAVRDWNKTLSLKGDVEYLPDLTFSGDYQLNTELALNAALNEIFAVKLGYLVKYRSKPPATAVYETDTQFTTALVAKF